MTLDDVRAAAEQLVDFHERFALLFGKAQAQEHAYDYLKGLMVWPEKGTGVAYAKKTNPVPLSGRHVRAQWLQRLRLAVDLTGPSAFPDCTPRPGGAFFMNLRLRFPLADAMMAVTLHPHRSHDHDCDRPQTSPDLQDPRRQELPGPADHRPLS
jgi:hypothetical protein